MPDGTDDDFDQVVNLNLKDTFHFLRSFGAPMIKQRSASIIETRLTAPIKESPEIYNTYAAHTLFHRWGQPWEVGAAVAFPASDASSYIL